MYRHLFYPNTPLYFLEGAACTKTNVVIAMPTVLISKKCQLTLCAVKQYPSPFLDFWISEQQRFIPGLLRAKLLALANLAEMAKTLCKTHMKLDKITSKWGHFPFFSLLNVLIFLKCNSACLIVCIF